MGTWTLKAQKEADLRKPRMDPACYSIGLNHSHSYIAWKDYQRPQTWIVYRRPQKGIGYQRPQMCTKMMLTIICYGLDCSVVCQPRFPHVLHVGRDCPMPENTAPWLHSRADTADPTWPGSRLPTGPENFHVAKSCRDARLLFSPAGGQQDEDAGT